MCHFLLSKDKKIKAHLIIIKLVDYTEIYTI